MKQRDHLKVVDAAYVPEVEARQPLPENDARLFAEIMESYTVKRIGSQRHKRSSVEDDLKQVNSLLEYTGAPPWMWSREDFESWSKVIGVDRKVAVSTQRKYQGAIRKFMEYLSTNVRYAAEIQRVYGIRPIQICDLENCIPHVYERELAKERPPFTHDQLTLFLESIDEAITEAARFGSKDLRPLQRDKAMFYTMYAGGLRISEALGLNLGSFSPNPVFPEFGNYGVISVWGKGSKGNGPKFRTVLVDHPLLPQLLDWYVTSVRPYFLRNADANETAMFLSERGNRIGVSTAEARFQHALEIAGLSGLGLSPHCLRHSSVTHGLMDGKSTEAMRIKHGHTNAATTQVYSHVPDGFVREEVEENISKHLDRILNGHRRGE